MFCNVMQKKDKTKYYSVGSTEVIKPPLRKSNIYIEGFITFVKDLDLTVNQQVDSAVPSSYLFNQFYFFNLTHRRDNKISAVW